MVLEAGDATNRQRAEIPLREDLAADLAESVADKQEAFSGRPGAPSGPLSSKPIRDGKLPTDTPLFNVPGQLVKILNRDLAAASIAKRDDRGRTIDVLAFWHTYGSLLSAAGLAPRTAQAAMRHSSIDITMSIPIPEYWTWPASSTHSQSCRSMYNPIAVPKHSRMRLAVGKMNPPRRLHQRLHQNLTGHANPGQLPTGGRERRSAKKNVLTLHSKAFPERREATRTGLEPATSGSTEGQNTHG
ncbi:MAG: hypothetical protein ACR2NU_16200 [Aeoliella sp.]